MVGAAVAVRPVAGEIVLETDVKYIGGRNIAMKIPPEQFDRTVEFYARLGMPMEAFGDGSVRVDFGPLRLWLDRAATLSQSELWLEINVEDIDQAKQDLRRKGVVFSDEIESLPDGFKGFWIKNPAQIVHLVAEPGQDD